MRIINQIILLYSWRFSRYSASIHWLFHGHMTSNNETVSRQKPWAGNIAKTMTSNGKQFTVTHEMLNFSAVFKFCFCFVLLYNKSLNNWSLGEQWILFPSNLNVSLDFISGNKIHCSPRDQSLSVNKCLPVSIFEITESQVCCRAFKVVGIIKHSTSNLSNINISAWLNMVQINSFRK